MAALGGSSLEVCSDGVCVKWCDLVLYKHEEQKVSLSLDLCTPEIKESLSPL